MNHDYDTHRKLFDLMQDCGPVVTNSQDKTVRSLPQRILLCHLRDLLVKKPVEVFPDAKSKITQVTAPDAAKDIVINTLAKPPGHHN